MLINVAFSCVTTTFPDFSLSSVFNVFTTVQSAGKKSDRSSLTTCVLCRLDSSLQAQQVLNLNKNECSLDYIGSVVKLVDWVLLLLQSNTIHLDSIKHTLMLKYTFHAYILRSQICQHIKWIFNELGKIFLYLVFSWLYVGSVTRVKSWAKHSE